MNVLERIEKGKLAVYEMNKGGFPKEYSEQAEGKLIKLAKLGKQMQWVSVEEKLPQEEDVVLVFVGTVCVRACLGKTPYGQAWYLVDRNSYINIHNVTYWMPLPPNPGEGE